MTPAVGRDVKPPYYDPPVGACPFAACSSCPVVAAWPLVVAVVASWLPGTSAGCEPCQSAEEAAVRLRPLPPCTCYLKAREDIQIVVKKFCGIKCLTKSQANMYTMLHLSTDHLKTNFHSNDNEYICFFLFHLFQLLC